MAAENMRKVETMRRKTLEKLRKRWYLVARRVIIDSVDLADPDRRSTIVRPVDGASCSQGIVNFTLVTLKSARLENEGTCKI